MPLGQAPFVAASDPALVMDWQQIRQSFMDPSMGPVANITVDPNTGQPIQQITVTASGATPQWPLWILIGIVGYALFWGGKHA